MKKVLFSLLILSVVTSLSAQTTMPNFSKHGYKKPVMFASKLGGFEEFHDNADIVEIGTVLFNTKTNQVVGFIEEEKVDAEVSSSTAAISIDPHCERYPWISPYAYCLNNPIRYVDPDGRDVWDFIKGVSHSIAHNLSLGIISPKAGSVSNANHYNAGRNTGDMLSAVTGVGEMVDGTATAIVGAVATPETGPIGMGVAVVGVAEVAHGLGVTTTSLNSMATQTGRIKQESSSGGSEKSNTSSGERNSSHANQKAKQSADQKYNDTKAQYEDLKSKLNKTPEDKKQLDTYKRQMDHWKEKKDFTGENHSQNAKGNR